MQKASQTCVNKIAKQPWASRQRNRSQKERQKLRSSYEIRGIAALQAGKVYRESIALSVLGKEVCQMYFLDPKEIRSGI